MPLRICIVTWAHVSNNPRVVKEADALAEAGHDVRVVAHQADAEFTARDADVVRRRPWRFVPLRIGAAHGRVAWLGRRATQRAARMAFDAGLARPSLRDYALNPYTAPLSRLAACEAADLVIGHNLRALPASARAAAVLGARLGFDFEDLHFAEMPESAGFAAERALVTAVEGAYVPRCDFLTASAPGIADEVARAYGVRRPEVILNSFSPGDALAASTRVPADRADSAPSLYWYSQVIGPERGLEEAIAAIGALGMPVALHLRGRVDAAYRQHLLALAAAAGIDAAMRFHAPAPADDLVALASQHDVGLALEQPISLNRDLCVTNKILTYLAAGVAVAATATRGQRVVMDAAPGAGFTYPPGDAVALAEGLRRLLASPRALADAKRASATAAAARFNWEHESTRLVAYLGGETGAERRRTAVASGAGT